MRLLNQSQALNSEISIESKASVEDVVGNMNRKHIIVVNSLNEKKAHKRI